MKKIFAIILSTAVIIGSSCIASASISKDASVDDQRAKVVAIAKSCQGKKLSDVKKKLKSYGKSLWKDSYDYDWCAFFVSNCAVEAGVKSSVFPRDTFANGFYTWGKQKGLYKSKSKYTPKPGDIALCGSVNSTYHIELVYSVNGKTVKTIGGNTGSDYWRSSVVSKPRARNDIYGYVAINYPDPIVKHTVEFITNGGSGKYNPQIVKDGATITIPTSKPSKTGYEFIGWSVLRLKDQTWHIPGTGWVTESKIGNKAKKIYPAGASYTLDNSWLKGEPRSNYQFVAQWRKASFTLKFNPSGGTGTMPQREISLTNSPVKFDSINEFKKDGFTFNGWMVQRIHEGIQYWIVPNGNSWAWKKDAAVNERKLYKNTDAFSFSNTSISPGDTLVLWASYKESEKGSRCIEDGTYHIVLSADPRYGLDVYDASNASGTNVQLYKNAHDNTQTFDIKYLNDGYYQIAYTKSGMNLDVTGASAKNRTNVQVYRPNNSDAQKFLIKDLGDGNYTIFSKCGGLCIDVTGAEIRNGANVQMFYENNSVAQIWRLVKVDNTK